MKWRREKGRKGAHTYALNMAVESHCAFECMRLNGMFSLGIYKSKLPVSMHEKQDRSITKHIRWMKDEAFVWVRVFVCVLARMFFMGPMWCACTCTHVWVSSSKCIGPVHPVNGWVRCHKQKRNEVLFSSLDRIPIPVCFTLKAIAVRLRIRSKL